MKGETEVKIEDKRDCLPRLFDLTMCDKIYTDAELNKVVLEWNDPDMTTLVALKGETVAYVNGVFIVKRE